MNPQQQEHPHSHLFTLRVWQEALGNDNAEWRGRVQDVASGETLYFRDWPGLTEIVQRLIAKTGAAQKSDVIQALQDPENDARPI